MNDRCCCLDCLEYAKVCVFYSWSLILFLPWHFVCLRQELWNICPKHDLRSPKSNQPKSMQHLAHGFGDPIYPQPPIWVDCWGLTYNPAGTACWEVHEFSCRVWLLFPSLILPIHLYTLYKHGTIHSHKNWRVPQECHSSQLANGPPKKKTNKRRSVQWGR